ncbi:unnamed protein product [Clavelina lepadiformis]|uniref:Uncharacterized protein n=1 Tax=Clavelina lepadiformis TaxID=159417 RepID=A0ABP0G796_CLALP
MTEGDMPTNVTLQTPTTNSTLQTIMSQSMQDAKRVFIAIQDVKVSSIFWCRIQPIHSHPVDRPCIMLLTKPRSDFVPVGVMYFSDSNPVMCEHFERVEDIRKQVKTDGVTIRFSRKPVFNTESYLKFVLKSTRH